MIYDLKDSSLNKTLTNIDKKLMGKKNFALLIYADWCPHCINLKPAWNEAASKSKCNIVQVNDDIFNKLRHGMDTEYKSYMFPSVLSAPFHGFPSIRMVNTTSGKDGVIGVKEYNSSDRDVGSLSAFFKDIYNSSSPASASKSKKSASAAEAKPKAKKPTSAAKPKAKKPTSAAAAKPNAKKPTSAAVAKPKAKKPASAAAAKPKAKKASTKK